MMNDYKQKGIYGLNYLLIYFKNKDKANLSVVKENAKETKFWFLMTFFSNNHDLLFDNIPDYLLHKLFNLEPIAKRESDLYFEDGTNYDYGIGIKTNCTQDYKEQLKKIRNALAHNNYQIDENDCLIINDPKYNYNAVIDPKWLEALVLCCLSNSRNKFEKNMNDKYLISLSATKESLDKDSLIKCIQDKRISFLKVTLLTNSKERFFKVIDAKVLEDFSFDDVYNYMIKYFFTEFNKAYQENPTVKPIILMNSVINMINKKMQGAVKLELESLNLKLINDLLNNPAFQAIEDNREKLQVLINCYEMKENPEKENTLCYKYLLDLLFYLKNDEQVSLRHQIYLDSSFNFIFKSFGNLIFNTLLNENDSFKNINYYLSSKYEGECQVDFGHSKNIFKEDLKNISASIKDLNANYHPRKGELLSKYSKSFTKISENLQRLEEGKLKPLFLAKIRNAFTHGFCNCLDEKIHFYDCEAIKRYPRFNKKSQVWEDKVDAKGDIDYNIEMSYEIYQRIIKYLCGVLKYSLELPEIKIISTKETLK